MWLLKKVGGLGGNLNARREFPRFREYFCPGTVPFEQTLHSDCPCQQSWPEMKLMAYPFEGASRLGDLDP